MLRLLTHNFSEVAFQSEKLLLRQVSPVYVTSFAAPLSVSCRKRSSPHLKISNHRILHTSRSNYDLQREFQKHVKIMFSQVDWRDAKSSPQPALVLGAAGLIPFIVPPVAMLLDGAFIPNVASAQLAYAATILSFLGGVKWGFAVPDGSMQKLTWNNLGLSVSLALIGWGSLIIPPWMGNLVLLAGLGASAYVDITSPGYPKWFKALRLCLSTVAMGSLALTFVLRILF